MDRDSNDDGRIPFRSLSCYQEICRLADKDCHFSSIPRRPLFVRDVYDMVDDPSTDSVVSWSDSGKSFIIWKESEFLGDVFPRCLSYDLKDMTSLTAWFNAMGYSKVEESVHWEYTGNYLVRGQPPHPTDTSSRTPGGVMISPEEAKIMERQLFGERPASPPYGYILTYSWGCYDFSRRGQNHGEVLCFPEGTQTISSVRWSCFALVVVVVFLILFYRPV
ncbi:hypothetical protein DY000_02035712 [Brassica cretica]|uniref:HSF-type DNA-binding domain-containing protein n=1 Tax=Brassica cretica TaxID=69181 RepID=A0ABQ7DJ40_BRACR|nr:hypothetical protein DY000_02035712 [Brassica cretica]